MPNRKIKRGVEIQAVAVCRSKFLSITNYSVEDPFLEMNSMKEICDGWFSILNDWIGVNERADGQRHALFYIINTFTAK